MEDISAEFSLLSGMARPGSESGEGVGRAHGVVSRAGRVFHRTTVKVLSL